MSRTYRKRQETFECYYYTYDTTSWWYLRYTEKEKEHMKARYNGDSSKYRFNNSLPRWFRNDVNRKRRAVDRREMYKEVHRAEYIGNYDPWNCKTSNAWGYW